MLSLIAFENYKDTCKIFTNFYHIELFKNQGWELHFVCFSIYQSTWWIILMGILISNYLCTVAFLYANI